MNFVFKEFFRGIKENISTILSFVPIIGFGFIVLIIAYTFIYNVKVYGEISRKEIGVDVFIEKGKDRESLIKNIKSLEGVENVKYLSSKEILEEISADIGIEGSGDTDIELNVPEVLHITLKEGYTNNSFLEKFSNKLHLLEGVEEVWYGKELIDSMDRMLYFAIYFFILFFTLLFISLLLFLYKVFPEHTKHAEEIIPLLYLAGVSRIKIKMPLLLLGFTTILFSSFFSLVVFYIVEKMAKKILLLNIYMPSLWIPLLLLFITIFVSLAGISSSVDRKINEV